MGQRRHELSGRWEDVAELRQGALRNLAYGTIPGPTTYQYWVVLADGRECGFIGVLGDESVTWDEVQDVHARSGFVNVKKAGQWRAWNKVFVFQIPNYSVFNALVRTVLAQRRG